MGRILKDFFEQNNMKFDKVVMQCSPFLRCIQTANQISEALGIISEIEVNYLFCEHLNEASFPQGNPIKNLVYEVSKKNKKMFKQRYGISEEVNIYDKGLNKGESLKLWPETDQEAQKRALRI